MARGLITIVVALFCFVTGMTTFAWGEVQEVTIIYSNNVNGQIYPAG